MDIGEAALALIIGHDRFNAAMQADAYRVTQSYTGNWALNRLINDRGRLMASFTVMERHALNGNNGFAVARLRDDAARLCFASPRRIAAWTASAQLLGYLQTVPGSRPQRLIPTGKLIHLFQTRLGERWHSIGLMHPIANTARQYLGDPDFLGACAVAFMVPYRAGMRMMSVTPELEPFIERDAGFMILLSLLIATAEDRPVSVAVLARRFHVSRSHVLDVLRRVENRGLGGPVGKDRGHLASPALQTALSRFFAALCLTHLYVMEQAMAMTPSRPPAATACPLGSGAFRKPVSAL